MRASPPAARGARSTSPTFSSARRCHEQFDALSPTTGAHWLAVHGPGGEQVVEERETGGDGEGGEGLGADDGAGRQLVGGAGRTI